MWSIRVLAELSGDDLTPSASPCPCAPRLPVVTGSAVQQRRAGRNRTARSADGHGSHSQQAQAEGRRQGPLFPPQSTYFEER